MNSQFVNRKISISYSLHFKFHNATFLPKIKQIENFHLWNLGPYNICSHHVISKKYLHFNVKFRLYHAKR